MRKIINQTKTQTLKTLDTARCYGTHDALDLRLGGCNGNGKEALGSLGSIFTI